MKTKTAKPDTGAAPRAGRPSRWTPRSRASLRREHSLELEVEQRQSTLSMSERRLVKLAADEERYRIQINRGSNYVEDALREVLRKKEDERRLIAAYKQDLKKAQHALEEFRASVEANAGARLTQQEKLAAAVSQVHEAARELQEKIRHAAAALSRWDELMAQVEKCAEAIELPCGPGATVPASVREALSFPIVAQSQDWCDRILGEGPTLKPFVVVATGGFEPKESLQRKPRYFAGETVCLTQGEAAEFLRTDLPNGSAPWRAGWSFLPPTLMTADHFALAKAEAKKQGMSALSYLQAKHEKEEELRHQSFLQEHPGFAGRVAGQHDGPPFVSRGVHAEPDPFTSTRRTGGF
jgi:hypothetical protein